MTSRIIGAVLTLLINAAATLLVLFMLLLAMNGYSESDATPGLAVFMVISLIATLAMATAAFLFSGLLLRKGFRQVPSVLIATPAASALGIVIIVIASFVSVGVAEFVRVNF